GMTVFGRGHEANALGRGDGAFSQAIGQTGHRVNVRHCAARGKHRPQCNGSGNLILARSFRIGRLRLLKHASFRRHFLATENAAVVSSAAATAWATTAFIAIAAAGVAAITRAITTATAWTNAATCAATDSVAGTRAG